MNDIKITAIMFWMLIVFVGGWALGYTAKNGTGWEEEKVMCSQGDYQMISYNNNEELKQFSITVNKWQYDLVSPYLVGDNIRQGDTEGLKAVYTMLRLMLIKPFDMDKTFELQG